MATVTIPLSRGGTKISMPRLCIVCGAEDCEMKQTTFQARRGIARVTYQLGGEYKLLRGTAAMADLPADAWEPTKSPVTFHVVGDGRLLWSSKPLQHKGEHEEFRLGVGGLKELVLCVRCQGEAGNAWAVWLEPHLLR